MYLSTFIQLFTFDILSVSVSDQTVCLVPRLVHTELDRIYRKAAVAEFQAGMAYCPVPCVEAAMKSRQTG